MVHSTARTVAKNASWLMTSQLLTWGMALLLTMFLPRYLGAEGVGKYYLAGSLWAIVSTFAGFGMSILLIKEIARKPEKMDELFGTSLVLRTLLFCVAAIGMTIYVNWAGYSSTTVHVIAIIGLATLITLYASSIEAILSGLERMEFISISTIIVKAIVTVCYILLLLLGYDVIVIAGVSVAGSLIYLFLLLFFINKAHPIRISFDRTTAYWMLKTSFPYFCVYIFLALYQQVDTVIISLLVNEETIGWYAVAKQLFGTLLFVPTVFVTAAFPAMARMHTEASESAGMLMSKGFDLLLLLSIPVGLGIAAIAGPLVALLFGAGFAQSGPVLAILGVVLIFTYQNMLLGQYYISIDKQRFWTWIMAAATIATIALDLILIPWCAQVLGNGAIGGAIAFVVTELGMLIIGIIYLPKGTFGRDKVWRTMRIVFAGLLMAMTAWIMRDYFIAVPVAVGAAVYLLCILLFRVIPAEDWMLIRRASHNVLARFRSRHPQPVSS
jgi:O-antigen/teichoic acid export membrane protein